MTTQFSTSPLVNTKQHFEILDGLRGVAAIMVVIFHFMEIVDLPANILLSHGYLAVDFFFCLSGFVMAYAYDTRAANIGFWQFIKLRLIRLHPLVLIGSVLGLITYFLDPFSNLYAVYGFGKTVVFFFTSAFLIPYPYLPERYNNLFNLNAPAWSLFWEYVANLFYILVLYKLNKKILSVVALVGVAAICYVASQTNSLVGGWSGESFWQGGARLLFSFTAGMLIFRFNWVIKNKLGFIGITILLILAFIAPHIERFNGLVESLIVLIYFPLLVALGAGASINNNLKKLCQLSGEISYPLYMTHYPFLWIFGTYMATVKPSMSTLSVVIPVSVISLIIFAYLIMKFVDIPLRKYLKSKLIKG